MKQSSAYLHKLRFAKKDVSKSNYSLYLEDNHYPYEKEKRQKYTLNRERERKKTKSTHITADVWGRLLRVETGMGHFNNMLQLSGLFLHFCSKEERGRRNDLTGMHKRELGTSTPDPYRF